MVLTGRKQWRACVLVLVASAALVSCGDADGASTATDTTSETTPSASASTEPSDDGSAPADKAVPPGTPPCSDVWQEGARLARAYDGCEDGGELVAREGLGCSSGQRLVTYADHYYAVLGGSIHETERSLLRDRGYVRTVRGCRA